jgi:hypothetical protein
MSEQSEALDKTVGAEALVHIIFRRQGVRFRVRCRIGEWRRSYNRIEFNVAPVAGEGSAWVRQEHVEVVPAPVEHCHADRDGDCYWEGCPQVKDGEPDKTGRHCPLDSFGDSDGL